MNKAINYSYARDGRFPNPKHGHGFVGEVFKVHDPPCPDCKSDMDFHIFENFHNTGQDYIQWVCSDCGFFKNVEIL
ncbi:MAG: hypothetical protein JW839_07580 [Candidatus Lokiarchaeota archaeon]|nr:hypothetical protein [Candidatus Lokiarchaeota archaeon]